MTIEYTITLHARGVTVRQTILDTAPHDDGGGDGPPVRTGGGDGPPVRTGGGDGPPIDTGGGDGPPVRTGGGRGHSTPVIFFGPTIVGVGGGSSQPVEVVPAKVKQIRRKS